MLYFLLFITELILLFVLSGKLINSLTSIFFRITRSHRAAIHIMAIIFLPGTIFHELAHLLFAGVMLVPVGELDVVPQIEGQSVKLGSVQIAKTDPLRRTIIGVAPVIFGLLLIFTALYFIQSSGEFIWWQAALVLYLVFAICNTMFSSKKDVEGVIGFLVAIFLVCILLIAFLYFINPLSLQKVWVWLSNLNLNFAENFFKSADLYLLVPLALDALIVFTGRSFKRLFKSPS